MGQAGKKWDKTWGEVGHMRLSGLAERTAPDTVVAVPEVPQQVQTGPYRGRQFSYVTSGLNRKRLPQT